MISDGAKVLNIDLSRTAVAGASAGANLAAVIAQKSTSIPKEIHRFAVQLLVVPVLDNTATVENNPTWRELEFTASLTATKMTWYRRQYLPHEEDWSNTDASPLLSSLEMLSQLPPTIILVAELDILRHEGEEYARKLKETGIPVDLRVMPGVPHPFIAMDAALTAARDGLNIICESLNTTFRHVESVGVVQRSDLEVPSPEQAKRRSTSPPSAEACVQSTMGLGR